MRDASCGTRSRGGSSAALVQLGSVVVSKMGRDKGRAFVVIAADGAYAYLVDGDLRRMDKPKKKKYMHIQATLRVAEGIREKLSNQKTILDAEFRNVLKDVARPN